MLSAELFLDHYSVEHAKRPHVVSAANFFATGEHLDVIPPRFAQVALCRKPNDPALLVRRVVDLLAT